MYRSGPCDLAHLLHREIQYRVAKGRVDFTVASFRSRCAQYRWDCGAEGDNQERCPIHAPREQKVNGAPVREREKAHRLHGRAEGESTTDTVLIRCASRPVSD